MIAGMGVIACGLYNYATSVWGPHIHPLCLADWVAWRDTSRQKVTDAQVSRCLQRASYRRKKTQTFQQSGTRHRESKPSSRFPGPREAESDDLNHTAILPSKNNGEVAPDPSNER